MSYYGNVAFLGLILAGSSPCYCNKGISSGPGAIQTPKQVIMEFSSEAVASVAGIGDTIVLQDFRYRFIPANRDHDGNWIWEVKLERVRQELQNEKKVSFDFTPKQGGKEIKGKKESVLDQLQLGKVKVVIGPDHAIKISTYPARFARDLQEVPEEIRPYVEYVVSEAHLESLSINIYFFSKKNLKKGETHVIDFQTPKLMDSFGTYKLSRQYLVTERDEKIARLAVSQKLTYVPPEKQGGDFAITGKVVLKKSAGSAESDAITHQLLRLNTESVAQADFVMKVGPVSTNMHLLYKQKFSISTSK
jgi:hypothetical protein